MSIPEDLRCPKCDSTDIAEIIYGPIDMTDELLRQVQAKKILIRNEPKPENPPRYYCYYCAAAMNGKTPSRRINLLENRQQHLLAIVTLPLLRRLFEFNFLPFFVL